MTFEETIDSSIEEELPGLSPIARTTVGHQDQRQLAIWLAAIALRDECAYRHLYDATSTRLFAITMRIVRGTGLAEDILQDSFIKVWDHAASYRVEMGSPMSWLGAIVRNRSMDVIRGTERRYVPLDDESSELADAVERNPEQLALILEDKALTDRLLYRLHSQQRQAFYFSFYHGLTCGQIAAHMEVPLGTIKTWIRRGLVSLRKQLESEQRSHAVACGRPEPISRPIRPVASRHRPARFVIAR